jgi:hypothetical protein
MECPPSSRRGERGQGYQGNEGHLLHVDSFSSCAGVSSSCGSDVGEVWDKNTVDGPADNSAWYVSGIASFKGLSPCFFETRSIASAVRPFLIFPPHHPGAQAKRPPFLPAYPSWVAASISAQSSATLPDNSALVIDLIEQEVMRVSARFIIDVTLAHFFQHGPLLGDAELLP